ncbi:MAG: tryptophan synthase subunit alpha [Methylococcales bacterium]|nr:tryptophan synthase subunit alpha [Methylococcales bacterium]
MSRLTATFSQLRTTGRKALIPFLTAGDPNPEFTVPAMHALVAAGADVIELGVPFSDPMADGPVIQKASERALKHKMSLRKTLTLVEQFRADNADTPVVLMGYLNPIEAFGYRELAEAAAKVGVDGILTVDLPPEEAAEWVSLLKQRDVDPIFLLAPNSRPQRIEKMAQFGSGYLYYVSLKGVTGAGHLDSADVGRKVAEIRRLTELPIAVGFGVKNPETALAVAEHGDGIVIGSALIQLIEQQLDAPDQALDAIVERISSIRHALDHRKSQDAL